MASSQPSHIRLGALRPCMLLGVVVGVFLSGMAVAWVLVANRAPSLEHFAWERNLAAVIGAGLLLLVPVFRFLKSPGRIFLSGVIAWAILSLTYSVMGGSFPRLEERLGVFHLFMLGAVVVALLATIVWVTQMVLLARQQTVIAARRRLP
jgi:hypothetical protein